MRRCFDLALLGAGHVAPNPMVGAVLVHEGRIIGEGWHREYGKAHAEVVNEKRTSKHKRFAGVERVFGANDQVGILPKSVRVSNVTVSYTHLTLPTSDLV